VTIKDPPIDNLHSSTAWSEPGYVEPPRSTGNRMNTDYVADESRRYDRRRSGTFRDRRKDR